MRRKQYPPRARASTFVVLVTLALLGTACSPETGRKPARAGADDTAASSGLHAGGGSGVDSGVDSGGGSGGHSGTAPGAIGGPAPRCTPPTRTGTTGKGLEEASGLAASRRHRGVLWTLEDSGNPADVVAIDSTGRPLGRVRVAGARNQDWEAIALGPCPAGECLYLADTGDNRLRRREAVVYRIPEPAPGDTVSAAAERFPLRYPHGPRDVEAIFLLPDGALYLVSKGRRHPVELFRYSPPLRSGEVVVVEELQRLSDTGVPLPFQVTGAASTPDGRWVAVRTYGAVQLYRPDGSGRLTPALPPPGIDLDPLAEPQGEGVDIRSDGVIFLISEAGPAGVPGTVGRLQCQLPSGIDGAPSMR